MKKIILAAVLLTAPFSSAFAIGSGSHYRQQFQQREADTIANMPSIGIAIQEYLGADKFNFRPQGVSPSFWDKVPFNSRYHTVTHFIFIAEASKNGTTVTMECDAYANPKKRTVQIMTSKCKFDKTEAFVQKFAEAESVEISY